MPLFILRRLQVTCQVYFKAIEVDRPGHQLISQCVPQDVVSPSLPNSKVFFLDFIDYFRNLSAAIENDEYFQGVALNSWVLPAFPGHGDGPTGDGVENDCSKQALVTHPDGVQEVFRK